MLFQTTKIQTFESNSQPSGVEYFRKARLFQTTKIQTFESNSQHWECNRTSWNCCFRLQRYKLLKAIHNQASMVSFSIVVVSDYKDTNFWKQFTTRTSVRYVLPQLFQTTKIQTFESNSQQKVICILLKKRCFRLQRYKLLKAIHNRGLFSPKYKKLFQTTKIQTFESNSQQGALCIF